jgi:hypothetical protein
MYDPISLHIGEKKKIKIGRLQSLEFIYCGMISKETFTVSILINSGYQGYAYNLFYPKDTTTLYLGNKEFKVMDVTPEKIVLNQIESLQDTS